MYGRVEARIRRFAPREGFAPRQRGYYEVRVTRNLGPNRNDELARFIRKRISRFDGWIEEKHGMPLMAFERRQDAQRFASELGGRLNIRREHIAVRAGRSARGRPSPAGERSLGSPVE